MCAQSGSRVQRGGRNAHGSLELRLGNDVYLYAVLMCLLYAMLMCLLYATFSQLEHFTCLA